MKNISVTHTRLKVADFDEVKPIPSGAEEVKFHVKLKLGKTRVQAWFIDDLGDGLTHGVYYVNVKWLS